MTKKTDFMSRREFLTTTGVLASTSALGHSSAEPVAQTGSSSLSKVVPQPLRQKRPAWWQDDGLIMAGVDWEPLLPRLRAGSFDQSEAHLDYREKMEIWRDEHSESIARRLKDMGFNFLMIPLYKGGGFKAERKSMEDAKHFAEICHRLGLRVGCYTFSGTILYESMLAENPDARDWFTLDQEHKHLTYGPLYFRRWGNRSHPGLRAHLRELVRYAVQEVKADLIHFDNYIIGPSYEPYSVKHFREYLEHKYSPEERVRRFGFSSMDFIQPSPPPPRPDIYNKDPLYQDFLDYRCEVLADTYRDLAEFARSLNPDVLIECNPGGYLGQLNAHVIPVGTVDHTQLLQWGEAFWDEGYPSRLENGILISRFRSHMIGRVFGNMVFQYTADPVAMAESMANNLQCVGCPAWVTGKEITPYLSMEKSKEFDPEVLASIQFFRREQQYYRDTEPIADVGVLNTFANTAYGPQISRYRWLAFTQALYQGKVPFTLVPECCAGDLSRFRVLVLADLALISDKLLSAVRDFVQQGGGVVITGESTHFDEHSVRRRKPGLADLFSEPPGHKTLHAMPGKGRAVYLPQILIPEKFHAGLEPINRDELLEAVRWTAQGPLTVEINAPSTVTMSFYRQPNGNQILHLVNYDRDHPVSNITVALQLPHGKSAATIDLLSPDFSTKRTLQGQISGQELGFSVPKLEVYSLIVIK
jgi:hypothetical protein